MQAHLDESHVSKKSITRLWGEFFSCLFLQYPEELAHAWIVGGSSRTTPGRVMDFLGYVASIRVGLHGGAGAWRLHLIFSRVGCCSSIFMSRAKYICCLDYSPLIILIWEAAPIRMPVVSLIMCYTNGSNFVLCLCNSYTISYTLEKHTFSLFFCNKLPKCSHPYIYLCV